MPGLWCFNEKTPEGKFPIVLRRDGTPVTEPYFVLLLKDAAAPEALGAYAQKSDALGREKEFVDGLNDLIRLARREVLSKGSTSDPEAPPHRVDDSVTIAWARSLGSPGT